MENNDWEYYIVLIKTKYNQLITDLPSALVHQETQISMQ